MFNSSLSRAALCTSLLLSACASYHDSRSPEQQKSALNAALNDLIGDYEIVDSRPASDYRRVSIGTTKGLMTVALATPERGILMHGSKCTGWHTEKDGRYFKSVMCDGRDWDVLYFDVQTDSTQKSVDDKNTNSKFEPMTVPAGYYLLTTRIKSTQKEAYFLMKRKEATQ